MVFNRLVLGAMAVAIMSGCSSEQPSPPRGLPTSAGTVALLANSDVDASVSLEAAAPSSLDPTIMAILRGIALQQALWAGVSSPATMKAVYASDRQTAQVVMSGGIVNDHVAVYVVEMTGGPFTSPRHPPGVAAPQGNALSVTIDAQLFTITDIGYHPAAHDLTQFGSTVVDLGTSLD